MTTINCQMVGLSGDLYWTRRHAGSKVSAKGFWLKRLEILTLLVELFRMSGVSSLDRPMRLKRFVDCAIFLIRITRYLCV